ncbi:MAG TPA: TolC family protein [Gemmataceae bacterium]|nr:TolC family protein [Gemmataceae bacterium]
MTDLRAWTKRAPLSVALLAIAAAGCVADRHSSGDTSAVCCSTWIPEPLVVDPATHHPGLNNGGGSNEAQPTLPEGPLSLAQLLDVAARNNPDVAVARARSDAARGRLIQAGLYPNPTVTWEAEDVGSPGNAAGAEGPIIAQRIVTGGKLRLAEEAAAHGVAAADWQAVTRWFDVVGRVRLAYYELLTAQAEVRTHEEIVDLAKKGLGVAQKLQKGGVGTQPDVIRAQIEYDQSRILLATARERADAATKLLATAVGVSALPSAKLPENFETPAPNFVWQSLLDTVLVRSSEVQEAQANVLQAERLLARAQAENVPDLQLSVRPLFHFPDQRAEVTIQAGATLPIFNRNQGNIYAAQADLARTTAEVRQVELRLMERLTAAYRRYQAAKQQVEAYRTEILPNARKSLDLIRLGYESQDAKYQYIAVLEAQRTLAQARLANVQALGELWRAVGEITALLQQDELPGAAEKR